MPIVTLYTPSIKGTLIREWFQYGWWLHQLYNEDNNMSTWLACTKWIKTMHSENTMTLKPVWLVSPAEGGSCNSYMISGRGHALTLSVGDTMKSNTDVIVRRPGSKEGSHDNKSLTLTSWPRSASFVSVWELDRSNLPLQCSCTSTRGGLTPRNPSDCKGVQTAEKPCMCVVVIVLFQTTWKCPWETACEDHVSDI